MSIMIAFEARALVRGNQLPEFLAHQCIWAVVSEEPGKRLIGKEHDAVAVNIDPLNGTLHQRPVVGLTLLERFGHLLTLHDFCPQGADTARNKPDTAQTKRQEGYRQL